MQLLCYIQIVTYIDYKVAYEKYTKILDFSTRVGTIASIKSTEASWSSARQTNDKKCYIPSS